MKLDLQSWTSGILGACMPRQDLEMTIKAEHAALRTADDIQGHLHLKHSIAWSNTETTCFMGLWLCSNVLAESHGGTASFQAVKIDNKSHVLPDRSGHEISGSGDARLQGFTFSSTTQSTVAQSRSGCILVLSKLALPSVDVI